MTLTPWNDGPSGGTPLNSERLNQRDTEIKASLKRWRPSTSYALGEQVVSPNNDVVSAAVSHTSGATFDAGAWGLSESFEPALPSDGTPTKFLRGDRTWQTIDLGSGGGEGEDFPAEVLFTASAVSGPPGQRLTIPTHVSPAGGQTTHPSVLFFPEGWNGYRYWMAHTPYPAGNDDHEDPNICASNDGITWTVPAGLTNPINDADGTPEYNSDVDLKMGPNNTMYLFWRFYDTTQVGGEEMLYYTSSTDGVTWAPAIQFRKTSLAAYRLASPSLVFEDNRWTMYAVDLVGSPNRVVRLQSSTADPESPWSEPEVVNVGTLAAGKEPWHIFMLKFGGRYYGILNDCNLDAPGASGELYFIQSSDGLTFQNGGNGMIPKTVAGEHDQLYRSTMVPAIENGVFGFRVWYTGWLTSGPVWNLYRSFVSVGGRAKGTSWTKLTLGSGWADYTGSGGYLTGLFYKREGSTVYVEGMVKSGAAGSVIATLPEGFRPTGTFFGLSSVAGAVGMVQINNAGSITHFLGAGAPAYLNIRLNFEAV